MEENNLVKNSKKKNNETYLGLDLTIEIILVYLVPILGLIVSFLNDKKVCKRAKFAYNQSATTFIVSLVLSIFTIIPFIGLLFMTAELLLLIFIIIAIVRAIQGEDYRIIGIAELSDIIWSKKGTKEEK